MQPLLASSFGGWGTASLDQDADELLLLLQYMKLDHDSGVLLRHAMWCRVHLLE